MRLASCSDSSVTGAQFPKKIEFSSMAHASELECELQPLRVKSNVKTRPAKYRTKFSYSQSPINRRNCYAQLGVHIAVCAKVNERCTVEDACEHHQRIRVPRACYALPLKVRQFLVKLNSSNIYIVTITSSNSLEATFYTVKQMEYIL